MDAFEKAAWEVDKDIPVNNIGSNENVIEFLRGSDTATVFFTQRRYIRQVKKLAEQYPDKVKICCENADGSIVAHVPTKAIHVSIRVGREMSDEEKEIHVANLKKAREARQQNSESEE